MCSSWTPKWGDCVISSQDNILVVRIPSANSTELREMRDYILESLPLGVLVLTDDTTCEVVELPVRDEIKTIDIPQPSVAEMRSTNMESEIDVGLQGGKCANEKRKIQKRLAAYRNENGLGCWKAVAEASGGKISEEQIRDMVVGTAVFSISMWRLAAKALDKLESKIGGNNGTSDN